MERIVPATQSDGVSRWPAVALAFVIALCASGVRAVERGEQCTLRSPLEIVIHRKQGTIEATLEKGTDIRVELVGDEGRSRIRAGDAVGSAVTIDIDAACSGTLRICRVRAPLVMYEENRSDSRSWRIKPGATVSVLKQGKTWAAIRTADLQGFAAADEVSRSCVSDNSVVNVAGDVLGEDETEGDVLDRAEGPGLLLVPFTVTGGAPAATADALFVTFANRTQLFRPDAARVDALGPSNQPWRDLVERAVKRARTAKLAFAIVGRLTLPAQTPEAALMAEGGDGAAASPLAVEIGLIDVATGKMVKGLRARPTVSKEDLWADTILTGFLELVPPAPGGRMPPPRP